MSKRKNVFASVIGNALEYYDVTLYSWFAVSLAPAFFPSEDPAISTILSFSAFAMGFLTRPFGGLLFGYIGDRYGRKRALMLSIFLVTIPTLTIGLLPTYAQIGFWAPLVLILCRMMQGVCTAGEYTGASILIVESNPSRTGFASSLLPASSFIGITIALLVSAFFLQSGMPEWAWRLPFILGAGFGLVGLYLRTQLDESPVFVAQANIQKTTRVPLLKIFADHKRNLFCAMAISAAPLAIFYTVLSHFLPLAASIGVPPSKLLVINAAVVLMWAAVIPISGYFSDRMGWARTMRYGVGAVAVLAVPVFWWLHQDLCLFRIVVAQVIFTLAGSLFVGPLGAFLATQLFPPEMRYSGLGFGGSIGEAVLGGTTPLIMAGIVYWTAAPVAPAFYLAACTLLGLIGVQMTKPWQASAKQ